MRCIALSDVGDRLLPNDLAVVSVDGQNAVRLAADEDQRSVREQYRRGVRPGWHRRFPGHVPDIGPVYRWIGVGIAAVPVGAPAHGLHGGSGTGGGDQAQRKNSIAIHDYIGSVAAFGPAGLVGLLTKIIPG